MIGEIHYVRAFWYRNSLDDNPAWRYVIPADANDAEYRLGEVPRTRAQARLRSASLLPVAALLGLLRRHLHRPAGAPDRHHQFRLRQDGAALLHGLRRHLSLDREDDDRDVPDTLSAIYEYPDHFHINYSCYFGNDHYGYGEQFMGNEGTLEVLNRQILNFYPEKFRGKAPGASRRARKCTSSAGQRQQSRRSAHHELPRCHSGQSQGDRRPRVGQQAAISGHMATLSFRNNKKVIWDENAGQVSFRLVPQSEVGYALGLRGALSPAPAVT